MVKAYLPYMIILVGAAVVSVFLFIRTWTLRRAPAGRPFLGLMLCTFFYSLGYAFELASGHQSGMLFWNKVQWLALFIYLLGLSPNHLDTTPLGLTLTGLIVSWGLFRFLKTEN